MSEASQRLADRLTAAFNGGGTSSEPWLWRPLLKLIATGQPVTTDQLAEATGRPPGDIRRALQAMPDTEYDQSGRIIGSGLTQRPTSHRYESNGRRLYTWCALDTLIFPAVLATTAHVESPCHATGTPIRLTVSPAEVTDVDPPTAVVSIVTPDDMASVRASFCNQVHFFASPDAAGHWLGEHPEATVVPVADAHQLGVPLTRTLATRADPGSCC
jgi:alkylmercury lyase